MAKSKVIEREMVEDDIDSTETIIVDGRIKKYNNFVLITNGFRNRVRGEGDLAGLITVDESYDDYNEFKEEWGTKFKAISKESLVMAAGDKGIYSSRFLNMVNILADAKNIYCPNPFLGMVCLGKKYPNYDSGGGEDRVTDIKSMFPPKTIGVEQERDWWNYTCSLSGSSMTSVAIKAIKAGQRVVFALSGVEYWIYKDDLKELISTMRKSGEEFFTNAKKYIRFVGPDLDTTIPPELLQCAMPYNKDALNRLVPGARSHGLRRATILLNIVSPIPEDGQTNPMDDYSALEEAYNDDNFDPIIYDIGAKKSVSVLDDDVVEELIEKFSKEVGSNPVRIARMMKSYGYSVRANRVAKLMGVELERKYKKKPQTETNEGDVETDNEAELDEEEEAEEIEEEVEQKPKPKAKSRTTA
jgi:hypothetical protein